jgi:hypothetical protein
MPIKYDPIERALTKMVKKHHPGLAVIQLDEEARDYLLLRYRKRVPPGKLHVVLEGCRHKSDYSTLYHTEIEPGNPDWHRAILKTNGQLYANWQHIANFTLDFNKHLDKLLKTHKATLLRNGSNFLTGEHVLGIRPANKLGRRLNLYLDYNRRPDTWLLNKEKPYISIRLCSPAVPHPKKHRKEEFTKGTVPLLNLTDYAKDLETLFGQLDDYIFSL